MRKTTRLVVVGPLCSIAGSVRGYKQEPTWGTSVAKPKIGVEVRKVFVAAG